MMEIDPRKNEKEVAGVDRDLVIDVTEVATGSESLVLALAVERSREVDPVKGGVTRAKTRRPKGKRRRRKSASFGTYRPSDTNILLLVNTKRCSYRVRSR